MERGRPAREWHCCDQCGIPGCPRPRMERGRLARVRLGLEPCTFRSENGTGACCGTAAPAVPCGAHN